MKKKEHQDRVHALDNAVRHRLKEETSNDIVKSAEKYLGFLQGNDAESK